MLTIAISKHSFSSNGKMVKDKFDLNLVQLTGDHMVAVLNGEISSSSTYTYVWLEDDQRYGLGNLKTNHSEYHLAMIRRLASELTIIRNMGYSAYPIDYSKHDFLIYLIEI